MRPLSAVSIALFVVTTIGLATSVHSEDTLFRLREEVRAPELNSSPDEKPSPRSQSESYDYDDCDDCYDGDDGDWGELFVPAVVVAGIAVTSPFWGPPALIGDDGAQPGYFPRYPYRYRGGYMQIGLQERDVFWLGVRARSDFGTNFDHLDWIGGNLLVETTSRFGFETDYRWISEQKPAAAADTLSLGDANLFYRFAQSDQFQARSGIGMNYLVDRIDSNYGFNFTYAADWYPVKPVVVSAEMDLGWLGEESLFHFRVTEGVNWKYGEAYVGYDYTDIGNFQLGGMVAGVRLWF